MKRVNALLLRGDLFSISEIYHENTKARLYQPSSMQKEVDPTLLRMMSKAFKIYTSAEKVPLTKEFPISQCSIEEAIQQRRSIRDFSGEPLKLEEISKLLYLANGITGVLQSDIPLALRAAPSAGALYPIELYPIVLNVADVRPGVYHYNVKAHVLELLQPGNYRDLLYNYTLKQEMILTASVVFLLTAVFKRTKSKYGERGYRYVLLDAGHIAQNLYLTATAMKLGVVSIGGFYDDALNQLLNVDGVDEAVVYIITVGKARR